MKCHYFIQYHPIVHFFWSIKILIIHNSCFELAPAGNENVVIERFCSKGTFHSTVIRPTMLMVIHIGIGCLVVAAIGKMFLFFVCICLVLILYDGFPVFNLCSIMTWIVLFLGLWTSGPNSCLTLLQSHLHVWGMFYFPLFVSLYKVSLLMKNLQMGLVTYGIRKVL
jgi:hypothetical protein